MKFLTFAEVAAGGASLVFASIGHLLAQAAPSIDPGIGSLLGSLGVMGVLVWYLWYHTSVSQPKMMDRFAAEQQASRDVFAAEMAETRAAFAAEQKELRETFIKEQQASRQTFLNDQHNLREHWTRENAELRSMLLETLRGFRTAVHDVKDTAQTAIMRQAASDVVSRQAEAKGG